MSAAFTARFAIWKVILSLFLGVALLAVCLWGPQSFGLTPKPQWQLIRWPTLAAAVLITAFSGMKLVDRRPQVRVNSDGILLRHWSEEVIPWSAIARARIVRQSTRWPFYITWVGFDLHEPGKFPPRSARARLFGGRWSKGTGDIVASAIGLDRTLSDLVAAIRLHAPPGFELSVA